MENYSKTNACSDSSLPSSADPEKHAVPEVSIAYRLRNREMLRKRQAETQEKDFTQRFLREQESSKQRKRGRGAKRQQGHQPAVEPSQVPELEPDPKPNPQEEAEPVPSVPMLAVQDLVSGMQLGAAAGELAAGIQDAAGEENVLRPAKEETPEPLNTPVEKDHQDNKHDTHILS